MYIMLIYCIYIYIYIYVYIKLQLALYSICAMQKHDSLPQPPTKITKMQCVPLTYTWQCDISIVDPTIPGVTSAHTGSASC